MIEYNDTARKQLRKMDRALARRVLDYMDHRVAELENPRDAGRALNGVLKEYWRYRIGDHRVICEIQDQRVVVLVIDIGHRREIYR